MLGTIIRNVDGSVIGLDVGTYLGSLDVSFDGSNDGNIEGLFLEVHWDLLMLIFVDMMKA